MRFAILSMLRQNKSMKRLLFVIYNVDFVDNFGICVLSAVAKKCGWEVYFEVFNIITIGTVFKSIKPSIVCYSAMSTDADIYIKINNFVKSKYEFTSIMGGPHPTFFPDVINNEGIDYICRGEGELAFEEFLNKYAKGENCDDIENFNSKRKINPLRNYIEDIDTIPMPDRSLIFEKTELKYSPLKTFMTSRGCPFSCSYCYNEALKSEYKGKGKFVRFHSPERVVAEICVVRGKYPLKIIKFEDDLFGANKVWLEKFTKIYKKEVGIPFNCLQRLDIINRESLLLLKEANCVSITAPIDSGSKRIREDILKRDMSLTNEEIRKKFEMIKSMGINVFSSCIIGAPTSTLEDEMLGVELHVDGKVNFAMASILTPFPKTSIWHYCKDNGLLGEEAKDKVASILSRSSLRGFTEKEKDIQWNLATLYPAIIQFSFLRRCLLWVVQHTKPKAIYTLVNVFVKGYLMSKYIYPFKGDWGIRIKMLIKAIRIEVNRMLGRSDKRIDL